MVRRIRLAIFPVSGYTLAEMMVAVAVIGVLAALGGGLILQTSRLYMQGQARAALQQESRAIMYLLTREIRQARSASIVVSRESVSQPYYSMITFTKEQGSSLSFFQNGTLLEETDGSHVRALSDDLRYLAFTFPRSDDMTILSVSITLKKSTYQGQSQILHTASEQVRVMD